MDLIYRLAKTLKKVSEIMGLCSAFGFLIKVLDLASGQQKINLNPRN